MMRLMVDYEALARREIRQLALSRSLGRLDGQPSSLAKRAWKRFVDAEPIVKLLNGSDQSWCCRCWPLYRYPQATTTLETAYLLMMRTHICSTGIGPAPEAD